MSAQPSTDADPIDIEDPEVVNDPRKRDVLLGDIHEFRRFPRELIESERVHLCRFLIAKVLKNLGSPFTLTNSIDEKEVLEILGDTVDPAEAFNFITPLIMFLHQRTRILKSIVGGDA